ncbi:MAG TPA: hypothetical protein PKC14_01800 [Candidatus Absconditabacterales bacterium]|nr:hypothetical protein [Candidatus Absconditabacterales bacterium]
MQDYVKAFNRLKGSFVVLKLDVLFFWDSSVDTLLIEDVQLTRYFKISDLKILGLGKDAVYISFPMRDVVLSLVSDFYVFEMVLQIERYLADGKCSNAHYCSLCSELEHYMLSETYFSSVKYEFDAYDKKVDIITFFQEPYERLDYLECTFEKLDGNFLEVPKSMIENIRIIQKKNFFTVAGPWLFNYGFFIKKHLGCNTIKMFICYNEEGGMFGVLL